MGIYKGRVNPLNLLSMRRINRIPPNFTKIFLKDFLNYRELDRWIYLNLDGRYCIKKSTIVDENRVIFVFEVGLENPAEMSMLTLACPHLQGVKLISSK